MFKKAYGMFSNTVRIRKDWCICVGTLLLSACSGQNFAQPPEVIQYGQKVTYNNQVDLLFVIDTSGKTSDSQKAMAGQIAPMIEAFNKTGLDYQIAVLTMDMGGSGEKGHFVAGTPTILNAKTTDLISNLSARLSVKDKEWHPLARGLESVKAALSSPDTRGTNTGFLREKALLTLVFMSGGDDRSVPADYKAWLDELRPPLTYGDRSWVAQYIGVLPDDANCKTAAWGYNEPGYAFIDLAKYSGGAVESICTGDLRKALTNVKARVLEMITEYPLNAKPIVASIVVKINGNLIAANDAVNGWTYSVEHNSVVFHGASIPPVDSIVDVKFDRDGLK